MNPAHKQVTSRLRFDWGVQGADALITGDNVVAVVVDVLSFTTTLSVAADLGTVVHPYPWSDSRGAEQEAQARGATLAGRRSEPGVITLSPASVRAHEPVAQLVLPSPNGAALAHHLAPAATCLGACLRNASAVAAWVRSHADPATDIIAVIAAGERWPDGSLRPAVEDMWGAGAVIAALLDTGWPAPSPEATTASAAFGYVADRPLDHLLASASGVELVDRGFAEDVAIAAETDGSASVPVLVDGAFRPSPSDCRRRPPG